MAAPRYFRRRWEESRGDQFDDWGASVWYFEVDAEGYPLRQVEVYDSGVVLTYDRSHDHDEFGGLGDQPIDADDFASFEILGEEFDAAWARTSLNRDSPGGRRG